MRIRRNRKRGKKGGRRVDLSALREVLEDGRSWLSVGVVVKDGDTHFERDGLDIVVYVELMPSELLIACRLGSVAGGAGVGVYSIPAEGTEVAVGIPTGEPEAGGIILATLSTANVPEGVAETRIVVVAPEVLVYDSDSGDAQALPTLVDVQRIRDELDGHTHTYLPGTGGATTTTVNPAVTSPDGTSVLKAK